MPKKVRLLVAAVVSAAITLTGAIASPSVAAPVSITLTAESLSVPVDGQAHLIADIDGYFAYPNQLIFEDETGGFLTSEWFYASYLINGPHTLRAHVGTLDASGRNIESVLATSNSVTISTPGFKVDLAITGHSGSRTQVDATVNAYLGGVVGLYYLVVYDLLAKQVISARTYANGARNNIDGGALGIRILRAYVTTNPSVPRTWLASSDSVAVMDPTFTGSADAFVAAPAVGLLADSLATKYPISEEACLALGQKLPSNGLKSTAPDATIICNSFGVSRALRFLVAAGGTAAAASGILALYDAQDDSDTITLPPPEPCTYFDDHLNCLDDDGVPRPDTEPEPEPEPGGGAVRPPENCIGNLGARQDLEDSMPSQYHHMATKYGVWGERFQEIADRYQLSVADSSRAWNVFETPHLGPHPAGYHQWVLDNMKEASRVAGTDKTEFLRLFNLWVVDVVLDDPTIVRKAYWECHSATPSPTPTPSPTFMP